MKDGRDGSDAVQVVRFRVVDIGLLLRNQHDSLVGAHGNVQRLYRLLTADEKRDHHGTFSMPVNVGFVVVGSDTLKPSITDGTQHPVRAGAYGAVGLAGKPSLLPNQPKGPGARSAHR